MSWTISGTGTPLYEHDAWAKYWRQCEKPRAKSTREFVFGAKWEKNPPELPFVDVVLYAGGKGLRGEEFKARLSNCKLIPHPKADQYYRDWLAGKFVIPGLKVSIKDKAGKEYGPAECKIGGQWSGRGRNRKCEIVSVEFKSLKKVRLED